MSGRLTPEEVERFVRDKDAWGLWKALQAEREEAGRRVAEAEAKAMALVKDEIDEAIAYYESKPQSVSGYAAWALEALRSLRSEIGKQG